MVKSAVWRTSTCCEMRGLRDRTGWEPREEAGPVPAMPGSAGGGGEAAICCHPRLWLCGAWIGAPEEQQPEKMLGTLGGDTRGGTRLPRTGLGRQGKAGVEASLESGVPGMSPESHGGGLSPTCVVPSQAEGGQTPLDTFQLPASAACEDTSSPEPEPTGEPPPPPGKLPGASGTPPPPVQKPLATCGDLCSTKSDGWVSQSHPPPLEGSVASRGQWLMRWEPPGGTPA